MEGGKKTRQSYKAPHTDCAQGDSEWMFLMWMRVHADL